MSEPIVFISRFRIKKGKLDDFKRFFQAGAESIKAEKPGTVAFLSYLNEDATQAAIIHVFPDASSMDLHVEGAEERSKDAYEFVEPAGVELYGAPSEAVLEMFRQMDGAGVPLLVQPELVGGYLRLNR